jgi:transcription elongation GreA/GreB family factor
MQMEVEKNRIQLKKTENLKHELLQIETGKKSSVVEFGSIVKTTQNNYFISSALGKIEINNEIYYCISLASPIGKLLNTKQVGDQFPFQEKVNRINEVH